MNFQLYRHIKVNSKLYIAFAIILFAFLFSRLPYFLWMPIPCFEPDTFDYYAIVRDLIQGSFKGFGILPPGYILFLFLMELLFKKTIYILIIQNLISLTACLFLIAVISKYYKKVVIPAAIAMVIYMMDSYTLWYDFTFLTESLYRNSLIIISGFVVLLLNTNKGKYWIIFSVLLLFPPLIRPNGLYIYFLLLLFMIYMFMNKYAFKYYLYLLIPFLILNIAWSEYNYKTEGKFLPGNPKRIKSIINEAVSLPNASTNNNQNINQFISEKTNVFCDLVTFFAQGRPQFLLHAAA